MATPDLSVLEAKLVEVVQGTADDMEILVKIDSGSVPSTMGLTSHALVAAMCRLEVALDIEIPLNCYIFLDDTMRLLSIKAAAEKLFKILNKTKECQKEKILLIG